MQTLKAKAVPLLTAPFSAPAQRTTTLQPATSNGLSQHCDAKSASNEKGQPGLEVPELLGGDADGATDQVSSRKGKKKVKTPTASSSETLPVPTIITPVSSEPELATYSSASHGAHQDLPTQILQSHRALDLASHDSSGSISAFFTSLGMLVSACAVRGDGPNLFAGEVKRCIHLWQQPKS